MYLLVLAVRRVPAEVVRGRRLFRSAGISRTSGRKASSVDDGTEPKNQLIGIGATSVEI